MALSPASHLSYLFLVDHSAQEFLEHDFPGRIHLFYFFEHGKQFPVFKIGPGCILGASIDQIITGNAQDFGEFHETVVGGLGQPSFVTAYMVLGKAGRFCQILLGAAENKGQPERCETGSTLER